MTFYKRRTHSGNEWTLGKSPVDETPAETQHFGCVLFSKLDMERLLSNRDWDLLRIVRRRLGGHASKRQKSFELGVSRKKKAASRGTFQ